MTNGPTTQTLTVQKPDLEPPRISPWSLKSKIGRILWQFVAASLWRWSPHSWAAFRNSLLRLFGASIGQNVSIDPTVKIEIPWHLTVGDRTRVCEHAILYCLGRITIGAECLICPYTHVCAGTHDFTSPSFSLLRPSIFIEDQCLLLTASLVTGGVHLARGTIVLERGSVFFDTQCDTIYRGNPARSLEKTICNEVVES